MNMMITGLVLVTIGAVLRYAVDSDWDALDVPVVGMILMCVGAVAFVVGAMQTFLLREHRHPQQPPAPAMPPAPAPMYGTQPPPVPPPVQPPAAQPPAPPANPPHA